MKYKLGMVSEVVNEQTTSTEPKNDKYCYSTIHEYYIHDISSSDNHPWTHDNIKDKHDKAREGPSNV